MSKQSGFNQIPSKNTPSIAASDQLPQSGSESDRQEYADPKHADDGIVI